MDKVHLVRPYVISIDWQDCLLAVCLKAHGAWRSLLEELCPLLRLSRLSDRLLERRCCPPGDTWTLLTWSWLLALCSPLCVKTNQIGLLYRSFFLTSFLYPAITQHRDSSTKDIEINIMESGQSESCLGWPVGLLWLHRVPWFKQGHTHTSGKHTFSSSQQNPELGWSLLAPFSWGPKIGLVCAEPLLIAISPQCLHPWAKSYAYPSFSSM